MQQHETQSVRCWSTADVDQDRALAYWVDTVCDRFIALDIDAPARNGFWARLEQVDLGPGTMTAVGQRYSWPLSGIWCSRQYVS